MSYAKPYFTEPKKIDKFKKKNRKIFEKYIVATESDTLQRSD